MALAVCIFQGMTLHRVSSHFYRMKTKVFGGVPAAGDDGVQDDIESGRRGLPDDAQRPTINIHRGFTKAVDAGQIQVVVMACRVCIKTRANDRVLVLIRSHGDDPTAFERNSVVILWSESCSKRIHSRY